MKPPTADQLDCLVLWPAGSKGEFDERRAVETLLALCEEHGFGRIPQLAEAINDIWHNGEPAIKRSERKKRDHLEFMEQCRKGLEDAHGQDPSRP